MSNQDNNPSLTPEHDDADILGFLQYIASGGEVPEIVPVKKRAFVFDIDGTIRRSKSGSPFPKNADDVEIYPDVEKVLTALRDQGYLVFGATNQGGVAFGYRTPEQIAEEFEAMGALFSKSPFHEVACCFAHPKGTVEPYNVRSLRRKPYYGLLVSLETSANEHGYIIDWDNSLIVGDRDEDREMAESADVPFAWAWDFFHRTPTDEQFNRYVTGLKEYRKDGWPLCPDCGEDELYSLSPEPLIASKFATVQAAIQANINAGLACHACRFHSSPR